MISKQLPYLHMIQHTYEHPILGNKFALIIFDEVTSFRRTGLQINSRTVGVSIQTRINRYN